MASWAPSIVNEIFCYGRQDFLVYDLKHLIVRFYSGTNDPGVSVHDWRTILCYSDGLCNKNPTLISVLESSICKDADHEYVRYLAQFRCNPPPTRARYNRSVFTKLEL